MESHGPSQQPNWAALDTDVLQQIMQHVPLRSRLRDAASVCSSWQHAAVAATDSITFHEPSDAVMDGLHGWLQQHGSNVTSLMLHQGVYKQQLKQLPCSNLRELVVVGGRVQLEETPVTWARWTAAAAPLLLRPAASLTKLEVTDAEVLGMQPSAALTILCNLRHLSLQSLRYSPDHQKRRPLLCRNALQHFTALTYLVLAQAFNAAACSSSISHLINLQHLELVEGPYTHFRDQKAAKAWRLSCAGWEKLQQLTCLSLTGFGIVHEDASSLRALTGLLRLSVDECEGLDTSNQLPITQLRSIKLRVRQHEGLQTLADLPVWLSQQQQLTHLQFSPVCGCIQPDNKDLSGQLRAAFAQLACSKHLQKLDMVGFWAPIQMWHDIFPATRQWPALTHLVLPTGLYDWVTSYGHQLRPAEVQAVVDCCPALQRLDAEWMLDVAAQLTGLQHLTHLEAALPCDEEAQAAAAEGLAALTGLRHLHISFSPSNCPDDSLFDEVFSGLSGMTRLTALSIKEQHDDNQLFPLSTASGGALARMTTSLVELDIEVLQFSEEQLLLVGGALHQLSSLRFPPLEYPPFESDTSPLMAQLKECGWLTTTDANRRLQCSLQTREGLTVAEQLQKCLDNLGGSLPTPAAEAAATPTDVSTD